MNRKVLFFILSVLILLSSCGTATFSSYPGVGRVKTYDFYSEEVPAAFEGFRIAFASDFHYKSKLRERGLRNTVIALKENHPDILLLGGDYVEGCDSVSELFRQLARVKTRFGTYGVMGNHDYKGCYEKIKMAMESNGMHVLEHACDTLKLEGDQLILAGIRNPFDLEKNGVSPTLSMKPEDFVIMLSHTPDYAEDTDIAHTDLVLAGHTHGGQVRLGKLWIPQTGSKYGKKFVSGRAETSKGIPVITTNGLGTSRMNFRLFTPSEIILVVLHKGTKKR